MSLLREPGCLAVLFAPKGARALGLGCHARTVAVYGQNFLSIVPFNKPCVRYHTERASPKADEYAR